MTFSSSHSGKNLHDKLGLEGAMTKFLPLFFGSDFYVSKKISSIQSESYVFQACGRMYQSIPLENRWST